MDDKRHRGTGGGRALAVIVAALLTVAAFFGYQGELPNWPLGNGAEPATPALVAPAKPTEPMDRAAVAAAVEPALVHINTSTRPFGAGAAGSGIVLTADGQVLTSLHVVAGADTVTATDIGNGLEYDAAVLGYDARADIALLQLGGAVDLVAARIGVSGDLRMRDEVLAIGNAGGDGGEPTVSPGTITGFNNTIVAVNPADLSRKTLTGMLEIAAEVSSGQSGGALADRHGAVVGVVTAASGTAEPKAAAVAKSANGYAVPIDAAMRIVRQIQSGTPTDTVHIGPTASLGVLVSDANPHGAHIDAALYGLPAQVAGLRMGEVITALDGQAIGSARALVAAINIRAPDDVVLLDVTGTDGVERTVKVVLARGTPH